MRSQPKIVMIVALFFVAAGSACSRGERMIKVADLPDTPEFQVDARPAFAPPTSVASSKVHVDVGYIWKQNKLFFFPLLNLDGRYVGYTGDDSTYIEFKKGQLDEWAAKANVTLPKDPSIPFWDAWGGKLGLIAVIPPFLFLSYWADRLWRRFSTGMWDSD